MSRAAQLRLAPAEAEIEPMAFDAVQASKRLGCDKNGEPLKSARWLLDQARAGLIPHRKLGKTLCFAQADLDWLLASSFCDPDNYGRSPK